MNFFMVVAIIFVLPLHGMQEQKAQGRTSTIMRDITAGSAGGIAETIAGTALNYVKNRMQQGESLRTMNLDPRVMYRGFVVNAGSMAPITAIQVAATGIAQSKLKVGGELSPAAQIGAGTFGGAVSALVSGPAELFILHKQNSGGSARETYQKITAKKGVRNVWRGLAPTMCRDGGFTAGYMGLMPVAKKAIAEKVPNDSIATLLAGIAAGLSVAIVTHPFDGIKNRMQDDLNSEIEDIHKKKINRNMLSTAMNMYKAEGMKSFFAGLTPRGIRVVEAILVIGTVQAFVTKKIDAIKLN